MELYRKAADSPTLGATAHNNLGVLLRAKGAHGQAASHFAEACRRSPADAGFRTNLANALKAGGDASAAIDHYRAATRLSPAVDAHINLGTLLSRLGQVDLAEKEFSAALNIDPACAQAHSNLLFLRCHRPEESAATLYDLHREFGLRHDVPIEDRDSPLRPRLEDESPLRVGFVSADLRTHPVAAMLQSVWPLVAADPRVQVFVYHAHAGSDAVTDRFRCGPVQWRDVVSDSDESLYRRVRSDRIDVLVDLSGHTAGNRLPVFARKPAPVQMSWLGYPFSTGLEAMDYYICDGFWVSDAVADTCFVEKMLRMPVATVFDPPPNAPPVATLPMASRFYPTFGCLSRGSKLNDRTFNAWAQVLHACPSARMVIGGISDRGAPGAIARHMKEQGIDSNRLDFHPRLALAEFLSLHAEIDLLLDTFPYGGGSTTLYGAWMGCPTLTVEGNLPQTRQTSAAMRHLSLDDFVVDSIEELPAAAAAICGTTDFLDSLRIGMRQRMCSSPICRPDQLARALVNGFESAWRRLRSGHKPAHISERN